MRAFAVLAGCAVGLAGCELQDVTVVDLVDVAVAEVYVIVRENPAENSVRAFLHGTSAGGVPDARSFDDAVVQVTRGGLTVDLAVVPRLECVDSLPPDAGGTCFAADPAQAAQLAAGDELELTITLGSGATVLGATTVPGAFALTTAGAQCRVAPDTLLDLAWSRSDEAWAYVNETAIEGLPAALAGEDIEADDPLYLLGLSISAADTTIVFPSEFGVFDRFDLDQDLAVRLQRGLPDGTQARVAIAAVERNYVNWVRGGNFNPSGVVRVSSLRGAATGVFGAAVIREVRVVSSAAPLGGTPDCS